MSGGSFDYMYQRIHETYYGMTEDTEIDEVITDLCELLRALEWWQSCDTSEDSYRKVVGEFKEKWFNNNREYRQEEGLKKSLIDVRDEINKFIDTID